MKVLIIGGGIAGSAIAWRLSEERVGVTLLERGRIGQEASWAAAGMIAPQGETDGPGPFFDLCIAGKRAFDECVERLIEASGVDPEYDDEGLLYLAFEENEAGELRARAQWQREIGERADPLSADEVRRMVPQVSRKVISALYLPTNRRVDNRKLTQAYAAAAARAGAELREDVRVDAVVVRAGRAAAARLHDGSTIEADVIVNAAGSWASQLGGLEADQIRLFPVRGQILCFQGRPGLIGPTLYSRDGHLVPRRDGRLLAGAVFEEAGYDKTVTMAGLAHVARAAYTMLPSLGELPFREAWAGLRPAADDLMPVIGPSPHIGGLFYATGHFRSGILLSALTANVIADLVMGRQPSVDLTLCSPARFSSGAPIVKRSLGHV
jgi:glycine oxidase